MTCAGFHAVNGILKTVSRLIKLSLLKAAKSMDMIWILLCAKHSCTPLFHPCPQSGHDQTFWLSLEFNLISTPWICGNNQLLATHTNRQTYRWGDLVLALVCLGCFINTHTWASLLGVWMGIGVRMVGGGGELWEWPRWLSWLAWSLTLASNT